MHCRVISRGACLLLRQRQRRNPILDLRIAGDDQNPPRRQPGRLSAKNWTKRTTGVVNQRGIAGTRELAAHGVCLNNAFVLQHQDLPIFLAYRGFSFAHVYMSKIMSFTFSSERFYTRQIRLLDVANLTPDPHKLFTSHVFGPRTHLSSCLSLISLSQVSLSATLAINSSFLVKNRIVASLAEDAM
jgi:hypothetical protein